MRNGANYNGDLESSHAKPRPGEATLIDESNPGFERGHSLPSVEEIRISNTSSTEISYDDQGRSYPSKRKFGVFFVAFVLALVVVGGSLGIAMGMQNQDTKTGAAAVQRPPKEEAEEKDPGQDIDQGPQVTDQKPEDPDERPQDIEGPSASSIGPTAAPSIPATLPPGTDAQVRMNEIVFFLANCGISEQEMSTEGSNHFRAVVFLAEEDGLVLDVPSQKDSPGGYAFLSRYVLVLCTIP
jgi:hypothetical protein